jgi:hypothetical protein
MEKKSLWDDAAEAAGKGLRYVYGKVRKAVFEADDPRKFGVFDMLDNLDEREKKIKRQVE